MRRSVAFLSLFFTLITLGCLIVSIIFPWYRVKETTILAPNKYRETLYYWDEYRITNENYTITDFLKEDGKKYDDIGYDHVKNVFIVSLTFICVATLLSAISVVLVFISFVARSRVFGIISGILMLLVFTLSMVSFFQFLRLNRAFRDDDTFCQVEKGGFDLSDTYCHKFMGTSDGDLYKLNFQPYVGFWLSVGAAFFSIFVFVPLFATSRSS
ncbi:hypothetical protein DICPUDRAFT_56337 [Dictyostelium purpureum]|uniref:Uncharacterized protein n=1 Tax=Dictyostelium purpureum TaxID=5786 RepID=F0ZQX6_DICPU|nr:uncharacterized protein DICPUDRAFT_56337 [Dictyostelium purpureum]EGC33657.1 hypothetical protein DICPUDRAFT_56337 [Dictyostelium purpureum]|eukprot:XP_003289827.1 hypothetical protein DICPUDRAFT_56337 [Dictyostelium purpureum]